MEGLEDQFAVALELPIVVLVVRRHRLADRHLGARLAEQARHC